ncbi:Rab1a [Hexamita inflata]|uniref:Rab1a n=1 Tax=Hexamita inflata TaxID=28002 RepID=A0AA86UVL6_9EUKA|nr:Rab1a [Hexamita inflata]
MQQEKERIANNELLLSKPNNKESLLSKPNNKESLPSKPNNKDSLPSKLNNKELLLSKNNKESLLSKNNKESLLSKLNNKESLPSQNNKELLLSKLNNKELLLSKNNKELLLSKNNKELLLSKNNKELLLSKLNNKIAAEQEQQRIAAEQEQQRIAAEQEQQRIAAEQAEQQRIAAELEQQRIAAEQAEQQRIAAEQAEQQRIAAEQEQQRIAAEQEQQRIAAEQAEQQRIAAEQEQQRIAAEQAEQQRIAAELEQQRIAAEQAEQQRLAAAKFAEDNKQMQSQPMWQSSPSKKEIAEEEWPAFEAVNPLQVSVVNMPLSQSQNITQNSPSQNTYMFEQKPEPVQPILPPTPSKPAVLHYQPLTLNPLQPKLPLIKYKLVLLGDSGSGKSSICHRLLGHSSEPDTVATISVENYFIKFSAKTETQKEINIDLNIQDTAGMEKYKSMSTSYVRQADIILIVFGLNNKESFNNVQKWFDFAQTHNPGASVLLIGNKCDTERAISVDQVQSKVQMLGFQRYIECSAKAGYGVGRIYEMKFPDKHALTESKQVSTALISSVEIKKEGCC